MIKVGITGQMGSGKTFVTRTFEKDFSIPVMVMDDVAKDIQYTNKELISKLVERFPEGYPDGVLDKVKMRDVLFFDGSGKNKKDMADIIQPYIFQEIINFYDKNKDKDYVIVETALLFEHHLESLFDVVVFVHSDPKLRKEKAIERDNISSDEYEKRMSNQISDDIKISKSDYIIINDYTESVKDEVYKLNFLLQKNGKI